MAVHMNLVRHGHTRRRRVAPALVLALVAVAVPVVPSVAEAQTATTYEVNTTADVADGDDTQLSMREAVNKANTDGADSVITFAAGITSLVITNCDPRGPTSDDDGNLVGDFDFTDVGRSTRIEGGGLVLSTNCPSAGLLHGVDSDLVIDQLSLVGPATADATPAAIVSTHDVAATRLVINDQLGSGIEAGGDVSLVESEVARVDGDGVVGAEVSLDRTVVSSAGDRGAVATSSLTLVATRIEGSGGAGIEVSGPAELTNSFVENNTGAGITSPNLSTVALVGTDVTGNGGDGVNNVGSVTMSGGTVSANTLGGIVAGQLARIVEGEINRNAFGVRGATVDVQRSKVNGNAGTGVEATTEPGKISDTELVSNRIGADLMAGGEVVKSTVAANEEVGVQGGGSLLVDAVVLTESAIGVDATGPDAVVSDSIVEATSVGISGVGAVTVVGTLVSGGAVAGVRSAPSAIPENIPGLTVRNSQFRNNRVGVDATVGSADIDFATFADQTAADISGRARLRTTVLDTCSSTASITDLGHNAATTATCAFTDATSQAPVADVGLRLVGSVLHPSAGSALLDAVPAEQCTGVDGEAVTDDLDQRPRPAGPGCEIGAIEVRVAEALDQTAFLAAGQTLEIDVFGSVVDPDDRIDPSTLTIVQEPTIGTASVRQNRLVYVADGGVGTTVVGWRACNSDLAECIEADVTFNVRSGTDFGSGYWVVERDGDIQAFGGFPSLPSVGPDLAAGTAVVAMAAHPSGQGAWVLADDGRVVARGVAADLGGIDLDAVTDPPRKTGEVPIAISANATGTGLWVFTNKGRILTLGDATPAAEMAGGDIVIGLDLDGDVIDAYPSPTGRGVYMAAADGGVFAVGDATFAGSVRDFLPPGQLPDQPVVGIAADSDGVGYWLVAADGGVFAIDAPFVGSLPALIPFSALEAPINGMVPAGRGYFLVASDGGVFAFDAPFLGSAVGLVDSAIVDIATI